MSKVSVIIPTYNAAKYLKEALDSVQNQTFEDFECIVVDDRSTDDTLQILADYGDVRFRVLEGPGRGIAAALNLGIQEAGGEYIARMDADDISLSKRFEKQVAFLDSHPQVGLCGTQAEMFNENGVINIFGYTERCVEEPGILDELLGVVVCHPTVMFRKELFLENGLLYNEAYTTAEDQELWMRALRVTRFYNIQEILLHYRIHESNATWSKEESGRQNVLAAKKELLNWLIPGSSFSGDLDQQIRSFFLALRGESTSNIIEADINTVLSGVPARKQFLILALTDRKLLKEKSRNKLEGHPVAFGLVKAVYCFLRGTKNFFTFRWLCGMKMRLLPPSSKSFHDRMNAMEEANHRLLEEQKQMYQKLSAFQEQMQVDTTVSLQQIQWEITAAREQIQKELVSVYSQVQTGIETASQQIQTGIETASQQIQSAQEKARKLLASEKERERANLEQCFADIDCRLSNQSERLKDLLKFAEERASSKGIVDSLVKERNLFELLSPFPMNPKEVVRRHLTQIEIEIFSYCNRRCWFCPNKYVDRHSQNHFMDEELYLKVLSELREINYSQVITYSRYNEPLADKIFLKRIRQAREYCPNAKLRTNTNGDFLNREYLGKIVEAGFNELEVQCYIKENETMTEELFLSRLEHFKQKLGLGEHSLWRTAHPNGEIEFISASFDVGGMNLLYVARSMKYMANNRGDTLDNIQPYQRQTNCLILFKHLYIDYNGSYMLCCNLRSDIEAHQDFILGNANDESIFDVFTGEKIVRHRRSLGVEGEKPAPCNSCNFLLLDNNLRWG